MQLVAVTSPPAVIVRSSQKLAIPPSRCQLSTMSSGAALPPAVGAAGWQAASSPTSAIATPISVRFFIPTPLFPSVI